MPITPQYQPGQVDNTPIRGGYLSSDVSPDSFGGAQARNMAQVAKGLGNAGDALATVSWKMGQEQEKLDNSLVRDASAQARAKMNEIMTREVMTKSGKEAIDIEPYAKQRFQETRSEIEKSLKTPKQREMFAQDFELFQMQNLDSVFRHQEGQREEYKKATLLSENKQSEADAVLNRLDGDKVQQAHNYVVSNIKELYKTSPEIEVKQKVDEATRSLYASVIEAEAKSSARSGMAFLERYKDKVGPLYEEMKSKFEDQSLREAATDRVIFADNARMTNDQALDYANKEIKDPKERDIFLAQYEKTTAIRMKAQTEEMKSFVKDEWLKAHDDPAYTPSKNIPIDEYNQILKYQAARVKEESSPKKRVSDPVLLQKLLTMPSDQLAKEDLFKYRDQLSSEDMNQQLKYQSVLNGKSKTKEDKEVVSAQRAALGSAFNVVKGLSDFDLSPSGKEITDIAKRAEVQTRVDQFKTEFKSRIEGMSPKELTASKVNEIVSDMMMPVGKKNKNWLGFGGNNIYKFEQLQGGGEAITEKPSWTKTINQNNLGFDENRSQYFLKRPDGSREYRDEKGKVTDYAFPKKKQADSYQSSQNFGEFGGNIDLNNRPQTKNSDGSISTVRSMSFEENGKEVLIPTVREDGKIMSDEEAINHYQKTGKFLGKFDSVEEANKAAEKIHKQQEQGIKGKPQAAMQGPDATPLAFAPAGDLLDDPQKIASKLPPHLSKYANDFVEAGTLYGIDPAALAAISYQEVGATPSRAFLEGNNAMGISGAGSWKTFSSVRSSIFTAAKSIAERKEYEGARQTMSFSDLKQGYSPNNAKNDPRNLNRHWENGVTKFYNEIRNS